MSKVLIETYRGWEIHFDTREEVFTCFSDSYDTENTKKSFAATKKYIDDYIKENATFVPFWVENDSFSLFNDHRKRKIIGVRKDGAFVYVETNDDKPRQFSSYDEGRYFLINSDNEPIKKEVEELRKQQDIINKKINDLGSKMIRKTVAEIRLERGYEKK